VATSHQKLQENPFSERFTQMTKNKIRATLLWAAMIAAMIASQSVAFADATWG